MSYRPTELQLLASRRLEAMGLHLMGNEGLRKRRSTFEGSHTIVSYPPLDLFYRAPESALLDFGELKKVPL